MTQSLTFLVQDAAGNIYGPAEAPQISDWIWERRITPEMTVAPAGGSAFTPIGTHALFAAVFAQMPPLPASASDHPAATAPAPPPTCGYAITALFLALGGLFICPVLPSLLGLWYARRSLRRIRLENADGTPHLGGRRLALTALVLSLAGLLVGAGCVSALTLAIFSR